VANTLGVNVGDRPHELPGIEFNNDVGDLLLHFVKLLHYSVRRIWDVVHYHVQVHLVWLVSVCVEALTHFNAVWMMQHF
jgi:hypothetical protein